MNKNNFGFLLVSIILVKLSSDTWNVSISITLDSQPDILVALFTNCVDALRLGNARRRDVDQFVFLSPNTSGLRAICILPHGENSSEKITVTE